MIAIELPKSHAMMHLDTVMTMIDRATFVLYPYIDRHLRSWTITPAGRRRRELAVTPNAQPVGRPRGGAGRRTRSPC